MSAAAGRSARTRARYSERAQEEIVRTSNISPCVREQECIGRLLEHVPLDVVRQAFGTGAGGSLVLVARSTPDPDLSVLDRDDTMFKAKPLFCWNGTAPRSNS